MLVERIRRQSGFASGWQCGVWRSLAESWRRWRNGQRGFDHEGSYLQRLGFQEGLRHAERDAARTGFFASQRGGIACTARLGKVSTHLPTRCCLCESVQTQSSMLLHSKHYICLCRGSNTHIYIVIVVMVSQSKKYVCMLVLGCHHRYDSGSL